MKKLWNRKIRKVTILLGGVMFLLLACGKKNDEMEIMIQAELFDQETEIGRLISEHVEINVKEVMEDSITVEVKAPDVTEALWEWIEENEFTEEGFDTALETAMKGKKETEQFQLQIREDGSMIYSEEFGSFVSCGMTDFYYQMQQQLIDELKEGAYAQN